MINDYSNRGLSKLFSDIQTNCNTIYDLSNELSAINLSTTAAVKTIDDELAPLLVQLDEAEKNSLIVHETGKVTNDMGISNLGELNQKIAILKDEINRIEQGRKETLAASKSIITNSSKHREMPETESTLRFQR